MSSFCTVIATLSRFSTSRFLLKAVSFGVSPVLGFRSDKSVPVAGVIRQNIELIPVKIDISRLLCKYPPLVSAAVVVSVSSVPLVCAVVPSLPQDTLPARIAASRKTPYIFSFFLSSYLRHAAVEPPSRAVHSLPSCTSSSACGRIRLLRRAASSTAFSPGITPTLLASVQSRSPLAGSRFASPMSPSRKSFLHLHHPVSREIVGRPDPPHPRPRRIPESSISS